MIVAITTLLGFITSLAPALINAWTRKSDQAHEQKMADKQLEAQRQGGQISLATEVAKGDTAQQEQLYRYAAGPSGNSRVDALNSLVRPYVTMVLFHMWLLVKSTALYVAIGAGIEVTVIVALIWDEPTAAIFGAVIGFWFGNRAVRQNIDPTYAAMPTVKPVAEFAKSTPRPQPDTGAPDRHAPS